MNHIHSIINYPAPPLFFGGGYVVDYTDTDLLPVDKP